MVFISKADKLVEQVKQCIINAVIAYTLLVLQTIPHLLAGLETMP